MAVRRRQEPNANLATSAVPAQDDEADIIDEVGAERDDETGELMVDEEKMREAGAVDTASVIENRRIRSTVTRKRSGEKRVRFNSGDLLTMYDTAILSWPSNTLDITMRRLTGTPVTHMIMNRPRSGAELYEAIKTLHGQYEEAEYEIAVKDRTTKQFRVTGRITMPDTRAPGQQGQPVQQYAPPGYPPPQYPQQQHGYPPQQQPQYQPQSPPPVAQPAPQQPQFMPSSTDPMAMMNGIFQLMLQMQQALTPPQYAPPQVYPQQPPAPVALTPPPQTADPGAQMAWMQNAVQLFQQMQTALQQPQHSPPQIQSQPQTTGPTRPAPPGMQWIWEPGYGFVLATAAPAPQEPPRGPMYRGGGRPPYYPQGEHQPPPQQPPAPRSISDQFRDSLGVVKAAHHVIQEMSSMIPGYAEVAVAQEPTTVEDDDSPVRVIETGVAKIVVNKEDGKTRIWETGLANADKIFKWLGEQNEVIQKHANERRQQQEPRRQLQEGYVEVHPGDQPPAGYVFVPVDQQQSPLPPPPAHVPPPIQSPGRAAWGTPTNEGES